MNIHGSDAQSSRRKGTANTFTIMTVVLLAPLAIMGVAVVSRAGPARHDEFEANADDIISF